MLWTRRTNITHVTEALDCPQEHSCADLCHLQLPVHFCLCQHDQAVAAHLTNALLLAVGEVAVQLQRVLALKVDQMGMPPQMYWQQCQLQKILMPLAVGVEMLLLMCWVQCRLVLSLALQTRWQCRTDLKGAVHAHAGVLHVGQCQAEALLL